ncbi:WD40-repeat-containing domain protein [Phlyctochytrium arcticum]|nr:WD40-repeat-containing domain protein [Phlyctochytrium arcticum]
MQQPEQVTYFSSPEGFFTLCNELRLDILPASFVGTQVSFVTTKTASADVLPTETVGTSTPARYVEVPVTGDEKGSFSFVNKEKVSSSSKVKKPKSSTTKPNSSFVVKVVANEQLAKILSYRPPETTYMLFNVGRAFIWADYPCKQKEPLSYIHFRDANVTCFDINMLTKDNIDTVIGFSTGDILWYSPISGKFARINKGGAIHKAAVTSIKWMPPRGLPNDENYFLAGFDDGSVIIFDKDKDDATAATFGPPAGSDDELLFSVSKPPKTPKTNPCSWWQLGKKAITAIAFSPDIQHAAIASMDGCLRVIDHRNEKLLDTYRSYFGGFTCVTFSPDGKYILTGGQDDLITIWQFRRGIIARCLGHSSWVTSVAFDPHLCTDRSYRFASVGDDTCIFLWDFALPTLHRPKMSTSTLRRSRQDLLDRRPDRPVVHPVLSRSEVAVLEPFMSKSIHNDPLSAISFRDDAIVTADKQGTIKVWSRPVPTT